MRYSSPQYPFLVAFIVTMIVSPKLISVLRRLKAGQTILAEGPRQHLGKAGTPTMGGLAILLGVAVGCLWIGLVARSQAASLHYTGDWAADLTTLCAIMALTLAYAALGFIDDWLTIRPKGEKRGIPSKPKFLLQLVLAVGYVAYLHFTGRLDAILGFGDLQFDLGLVYAPFAVLFIVGMANFVNITDGLDGLAAGLMVLLAVVAGADNNCRAAQLGFAISGSCLAFLWFNFSPAKVFMGDTGSLALGAAIPAIAIAAGTEILVILAGLVFIADGLSSALQWAVFKYTRIRTGTGRRVFKMSPVHHHFELSGWAEQLVVVRFWILGLLCAVIAVMLFEAALK